MQGGSAKLQLLVNSTGGDEESDHFFSQFFLGNEFEKVHFLSRRAAAEHVSELPFL